MQLTGKGRDHRAELTVENAEMPLHVGRRLIGLESGFEARCQLLDLHKETAAAKR